MTLVSMPFVNPVRKVVVSDAPQGGGGFNRLSAGNKTYGGGRPMPNIGRVDNAQAARGYQQRDAMAEARRNALIRRAGGTA